jgi:hypothetical protein
MLASECKHVHPNETSIGETEKASLLAEDSSSTYTPLAAGRRKFKEDWSKKFTWLPVSQNTGNVLRNAPPFPVSHIKIQR